MEQTAAATERASPQAESRGRFGPLAVCLDFGAALPPTLGLLPVLDLPPTLGLPLTLRLPPTLGLPPADALFAVALAVAFAFGAAALPALRGTFGETLAATAPPARFGDARAP